LRPYGSARSAKRELHESSRIVNDLAIRPGGCRQSDDGGDYALGWMNERAMIPDDRLAVARKTSAQAGCVESA
jgi:hypothetical protein